MEEGGSSVPSGFGFATRLGAGAPEQPAPLVLRRYGRREMRIRFPGLWAHRAASGGLFFIVALIIIEAWR
jgi:hypothetical protein